MNSFLSNLSLFIFFFFLSSHALEVKPEVSRRSQSFATHAFFVPQTEDVKDEALPAPAIRPAQSMPNLFRRANKSWTGEEERRLLELRKKRMSWGEMTEHFPGRSWKALSDRYYILTRDPSAPKRKVNPSWMPKEDKLLTKLVEDGLSWNEIVKHLPGRTKNAIKARYKRLTVDSSTPQEFQKNNTAEEEDLLIEALEAGMTWEEIAQRLERPIDRVKRRARKLEKAGRVDTTPVIAKGRHYTDAEFNLMRELREKGMTWVDIAKEYFPGRPVRSMAQQYKKYQNKEEEREGEEP